MFKFIFGCLMITNCVVAQAEFIDRGNNFVYDTEQNITWVADLSVFSTLLANDQNIVSKILAKTPTIANSGYISYDVASPNGVLTNYTLTADDFGSKRMTVFGAAAFANYVSLGGFDDWRIAGNLYFDKLGNFTNELKYLMSEGFGYGKTPTQENTNTINLFNAQSFYDDAFWLTSQLDSIGGNGTASYVNTSGTISLGSSTAINRLNVMLVRSGDTLPVPEPQTFTMLMAGLGLIGFVQRRKKLNS